MLPGQPEGAGGLRGHRIGTKADLEADALGEGFGFSVSLSLPVKSPESAISQLDGVRLDASSWRKVPPANLALAG